MRKLADCLAYTGFPLIVVSCALFLVEFWNGSLLSFGGLNLSLSVLAGSMGLVCIITGAIVVGFFVWISENSFEENVLSIITGTGAFLLLVSLTLFLADALLLHGASLVHITRLAAVGSSLVLFSVIGPLIVFFNGPPVIRSWKKDKGLTDSLEK